MKDGLQTSKKQPQETYNYQTLRGFIKNLQSQNLSSIYQYLTQKLSLNGQDECTLVRRGFVSIRMSPENLDAALADLDVALAINPKNDLALSLKADIYFKKKDWALAIQMANAALSINDKNEFAYLCRGKAYANQGMTKEASDDLIKAFSFDPQKILGLVKRGVNHYRLKNYKLAAVDLAVVIRIAPTHSPALFWLGLTYSQLSRLDDALQMLTKAISQVSFSKDSSQPTLLPMYIENALIHRARIYSYQKKFKEALDDLNQLIACAPITSTRKDEYQANVYCERGKIYGMQKEYTRAIEDFTMSLEKKPVNTQALILRGIAHLERWDFRSSLSDFIKAHTSSLNRSDYLFSTNYMKVWLERLKGLPSHQLEANLNALYEESLSAKESIKAQGFVQHIVAIILNHKPDCAAALELRQKINDSLNKAKESIPKVSSSRLFINISEKPIAKIPTVQQLPAAHDGHSKTLSVADTDIEKGADTSKPEEQTLIIEPFWYLEEPTEPTTSTDSLMDTELSKESLSSGFEVHVGENTLSLSEERIPTLTILDPIEETRSLAMTQDASNSHQLAQISPASEPVLDKEEVLPSQSRKKIRTKEKVASTSYKPLQTQHGREHPLKNEKVGLKYLGLKRLQLFNQAEQAQENEDKEKFIYTDLPLQRIPQGSSTQVVNTYTHSLNEAEGSVQLSFEFLTKKKEADLQFPPRLRTTFVIAARQEQSFIPCENRDGRVLLFLVEEEREFAKQAAEAGMDVIILKSFTLAKPLSAEEMKLVFARRIAIFIIARFLGIQHCMVLDDNITSYHLEKTEGSEEVHFRHVYNKCQEFSVSHDNTVVCIETRRYTFVDKNSEFAQERVAPKSFFYDMEKIASVFPRWEDYQMLLPPDGNYKLGCEDYYFTALLFHLGRYTMTLPKKEIVLSRGSSSGMKDFCLKSITTEAGIPPQWTDITNPCLYNNEANRAFDDVVAVVKRTLESYHHLLKKITNSSFFKNNFKEQDLLSIPMPALDAIKAKLAANEDFLPLKPHQIEAIQSFIKKGTLTSLFELPTGTGKTILFLKLMQLLRIYIEFFRLKNVGIIACDLTLAKQIKEAMFAFNELLPENHPHRINIEEDVCVVGSGMDICQDTLGKTKDPQGGGKIYIFCKNSFENFILGGGDEQNKRHQQMFGCLIMDEIHRLDLECYSKNNPLRPQCLVLGFDATPEKKRDKFDTVYKLSIHEALRKSLIVPFSFRSFSGKDSEYIRNHLVELLHNVSHPQGGYLKTHSGIIYASCIKEAKAISDELNQAGINAASIHSEIAPAKREALLRAFNTGKINCLIAVGMLSVGFDSKKVDFEIFPRCPSESHIVIQRVGRALRKSDENKEKTALIIGPEGLLPRDLVSALAEYDEISPNSVGEDIRKKQRIEQHKENRPSFFKADKRSQTTGLRKPVRTGMPFKKTTSL